MTDLFQSKESFKPKINRLNVCLRITDFQVYPHEITRILGISPCNTWLKGDIIDKTGKATIAHKQNGWEICSELASNNKSDHFELQSCISNILDTIKPFRDNFKNLPAEAFIELSCVIYVYTENTPSINIDSISVKELSYINANIDIDYYNLVDAG